ncbi:MAG TPA: glycosyltransferase [Armatimonadetes bacterium]|nr:glycosyltransferase [Armatimonadota bacterium]
MRKQYALPPLNKALAIGYIGRLIPEKGVDLLIRAIARFPNMHLIIVGDGPERVILTKLSYALGVATRIQFLGALAHECLPKLLNALDVVVLPSRSTSHWQEQFGRALVEAMACGIPVIGSSCGAIPEVIGDAGLIFQEGNLESLCTALKRVAEDSMLRHSLGLKARKRAMDVFDENVVARITLDVYNQLTA